MHCCKKVQDMGMPGTFDKVSKEIKSTGYTVCPKNFPYVVGIN